MGYEFGAKIKTDVVKGSIKDVEQPQWNLSGWIASVNSLKKQTPVFCEEGTWKAVSSFDRDILFLEKLSIREHESVMVCVNKNKYNSRRVSSEEYPNELGAYSSIMAPLSDDFKKKPKTSWFEMGPADIVLFFK
jgi:hypothetical protein